MAVINAPEPFCQYHLRNWLIHTICHTPWQLKFEWQFGEVHWFDSANQRHPKRNAIYYHHCNKKWKSSCVSITESSLIKVILNLWGGGVGVLVQLHNPGLSQLTLTSGYLTSNTWPKKQRGASIKIIMLFDTAILPGRRLFVSHKSSRNDAIKTNDDSSMVHIFSIQPKQPRMNRMMIRVWCIFLVFSQNNRGWTK